MLDTKALGKVAVLMGGISAEREVSLDSGEAVLAGLVAKGVDAHGVDASPENIGQLAEQGFERAFIVLHGQWGEDGVVQGALQAIGMPYTGSGVLACALTMDKVRSKLIWQQLGLPTADFKVIRSSTDLDTLIDELGLPLFLKPVSEGSSVGVAKVEAAADLHLAYEYAASLGGEVMAEKFIEGAELTVSILGDKALPIIEMRTKNTFYDYQAKYQSDDTQYICPANLSDALSHEIQTIALQAFKALDCEVWGRVDLMLDANQCPLLLEVNTVPGMTSHSLVPMAAAAEGISFEQLVVDLLATTLEARR